VRVVVSGSHGLIGSALVPALAAGGHSVLRLVRDRPGPDDVSWDPQAGELDTTAMAGADAVVHLAGAGLADKRWTPTQRRVVIESRTRPTSLLATRLAAMDDGPRLLLSASAIGYYGDRGEEVLTEQSSAGTGFLADLCQAWEAATAPAEQAGVRVIHLRTGIVQSPAGGALGRQLPLFKLGLGAKLGSGRQWTSWISLDDEVGAILHALRSEELRGPLNLTSPAPVTNAEYTRTLARVLHRPALFSVPGFGLELVLGRDLAREALLGGQRVLPGRLSETGYTWRDPDLDSALGRLLNR